LNSGYRRVLPVSDSDCAAEAGAVGSAAADGEAAVDEAELEPDDGVVDEDEELLQAARAAAAIMARAGSARAFDLIGTVGYSFIVS
jgi:hypothetical protein